MIDSRVETIPSLTTCTVHNPPQSPIFDHWLRHPHSLGAVAPVKVMIQLEETSAIALYPDQGVRRVGGRF